MEASITGEIAAEFPSAILPFYSFLLPIPSLRFSLSLSLFFYFFFLFFLSLLRYFGICLPEFFSEIKRSDTIRQSASVFAYSRFRGNITEIARARARAK